MRQTVVLVHGAYADSWSWNSVIRPLRADGHRVIAWANPLRGPAADAAALTALLRSLDGPIVLVGHSYGGAVLTNVPGGAADVVALVLVAGLALEPGETVVDAVALVPGSTLDEALVRVPLAGGGADTYLAPERYHQQFCADLPAEEAALMAATQRPLALAALREPSGDQPLWRTRPCWSISGALDRTVPAGAHRIMADRVRAQRAIELPGASHAVGASHHRETVNLIREAASATGSAGT